VIQEGAIL
jgi:hypothetical protein